MRKILSRIFGCKSDDIKDLSPLKKGMNNTSYIFTIDKEKYHLRVPGVGTEKFINRNEEYNVYQRISHLNFSEDVIYFDPTTGYKIARYWDNARVCNPNDIRDVDACMKKLKELHESKITVEHIFDPFERIDYFESLWTQPSRYNDYFQIKSRVMALKEYISSFSPKYTLSHIDSVSDNFIFLENGQIRLIDWEYAAMQDPHIDIAMFVTYSPYDKAWIDRIIDLYFQGVDNKTRGKIYAYIAVVGLCWSNWCEYKYQQGVDYSEWGMQQYQYAKSYSTICEHIIFGTQDC